MKRILLNLMICTTILALALMSCTANSTSKLDTPTAVPVATETRAAPTPRPVAQPTVSEPTIELVPYASDAAAMDSLVRVAEDIKPFPTGSGQ